MKLNTDYILQICLGIREVIKNTLIQIVTNLSARPPSQYDFDKVRQRKSKVHFVFISLVVFAIEM